MGCTQADLEEALKLVNRAIAVALARCKGLQGREQGECVIRELYKIRDDLLAGRGIRHEANDLRARPRLLAVFAA